MSNAIYFTNEGKKYKGYIQRELSNSYMIKLCHNGSWRIVSKDKVTKRKENRDKSGKFATTNREKVIYLYEFNKNSPYPPIKIGEYVSIDEMRLQKVTMTKNERIVDILTFVSFSLLLMILGFYLGIYIISLFK